MRRNARVFGTVAIAAALLGGCVPKAAPPAWPGVGTVTPYSGAECRSVTVLGDSLAATVGPRLESRLESSGRCATVDTAATNAATAPAWLSSRWPSDLATLSPGSVLVVEFLGNQKKDDGTLPEQDGPLWTSTTWLTEYEDAAVAMTVQALDAGVHVYWAIPPVSRFVCAEDFIGTQRYKEWAHWVANDLTTAVNAERPALIANFHLADWRTPFGGDTYTSMFTFPDGSARTLRAADCIHLTDDGAAVGADATVAAIQHEWSITP